MATLTGGTSGAPVTFLTSTPLQTVFATNILALSTPGSVDSTSGNLLSAVAVITGAGTAITGQASIPSAQVLLDGQGGVYFTGGTTLSTVIAADNSSSTIENNNPFGGLIGVTGAGPNQLLGLAGVNQFATGIGGQDLVVLNGVANSLVSSGSDNVLVGGPSTIAAAGTGVDLVTLTAGTTLSFTNGTTATANGARVADTITGFSGSSIIVAGAGNTSIVAGAGPEAFTVDTSAGNVTLGASGTQDAFSFVKNLSTATGMTTVNNYAAGDTISLTGYGTVAGSSFNVTTSGANTVLSLSDGSKVTFTGTAAITLTSVK